MDINSSMANSRHQATLVCRSASSVDTVFLRWQFNYRANKKSENEFLNRPVTLLMFQMIPVQHPKVDDQTPAKKSAINKLKLIPRLSAAEKTTESDLQSGWNYANHKLPSSL